MKIKLASVRVNLGVLVNLFLVSSSPYFLSNLPIARAQEATSECSLPTEIAITFLKSKCKEVKLEKPRTFYRYYSDSSNKYGRYLTTNKYKTNVAVIKHLALNQTWQPPNQATMIETVTLPAGTTVYEGIVAPQTPAKCYPGGGQQTFIQDSRDPNITWSDGESLVIKEFSCQQN